MLMICLRNVRSIRAQSHLGYDIVAKKTLIRFLKQFGKDLQRNA